MALCRKCNTVNEEGLTRCRACNAILPVKIGSKSETRWERVRRQPDLVGMKCPSCGAVNPYTRFRCKDCNTPLGKGHARSGVDKFWVFVGIGAVILAAVIFAALRGM
ncbi:MAG: hypothetical protein JSV79_07390 [Armatimonadota bacterium]|nr:MAG: hypothetical protein JSV79_07390 [Armatimonadota bacterium]